MQTKLISKEGVSAKFEVTIPAAEVDRMYDKVLSAISRQVKIPGFRPGKAPRGMIIKQVGQDALDQEVRDALVEAAYPKALRELALTPVHAHVHAHEAKSGEDYRFEVTVDLYPEFELADLEEIVIDTAVPELTDEMVAEAVGRLRSDYATLVPVERPVAEGDYVVIEMPSGGTIPIDLERVSPELAAQFIGKAMGESFELSLMPSRSDAEGDAEPKPMVVTLKEIKEKEKPAADDEFAKTLGFERWDEVEAQLRRSMQAELEAEAFEAQRQEFIDKLVAQTAVELPASLVARRRARLLDELADELKERGETLEGYLKTLEEKGERESFERQLTEAAEKGVKRELVLEQLLKLRGSKVDDAEFEAALRYFAQRDGVSVGKFRAQLGEAGLENLRHMLQRDKAVREALQERLGKAGPAAAVEVPTEAEPQ